LRWKVRLGKRGGVMRDSSDGKTVCHGSVDAAVIRRGATAMAAAARVRSFMNSRRVVIDDFFHAKTQRSQRRKGGSNALGSPLRLCDLCAFA